MSEDPLVTLATIWTHRPKRCWLLYDKVHERVYRNVYRLLQLHRCEHGNIKIEVSAKSRGEAPSKGKTIRKVRVKPWDGTPAIFTWEGGAWLEALAAHALARLDGIEVCTGFEWAWKDSDYQKGEIDIVAAHSGSIYVFECKTDMQMLDKGSARAGNMAAACFGRFAIPAVIVPWIDKPERDSFQDNPIPVICMYDLLNEKRVAATLVWLRRHPSTFKSGKVFKLICHDH